MMKKAMTQLRDVIRGETGEKDLFIFSVSVLTFDLIEGIRKLANTEMSMEDSQALCDYTATHGDFYLVHTTAGHVIVDFEGYMDVPQLQSPMLFTKPINALTAALEMFREMN